LETAQGKFDMQRQKLDYNWGEYEKWSQDPKNFGVSYQSSPWGESPNRPASATQSSKPDTSAPRNTGTAWSPQ
jgi:hypothetical protein